MLSVRLMGWMKFLYFASVFGYGLQGLALNEFQSSPYTKWLPAVDAYYAAHPNSTLTVGQVCLACLFVYLFLLFIHGFDRCASSAPCRAPASRRSSSPRCRCPRHLRGCGRSSALQH